MRVGFIGAGTMAKTMARHLICADHDVVISNSRGPQSLVNLVDELGPHAKAGTKQDAVDCDLVILATNWANVSEALEGIDWRGRILVDGTNAHVDARPDTSLNGVARSIAALSGRLSSERVAELAEGARLVKSISNVPMAWIQDFSARKPRTVLFTSGDDAGAKEVVIDLINSTGLVAIDLGFLAQGGALQQLGAQLSGLELHLARRILR